VSINVTFLKLRYHDHHTENKQFGDVEHPILQQKHSSLKVNGKGCLGLGLARGA